MFCPKCGNKLDDDAMFCPNCGAKVDSSVSPVQQARPRPILTEQQTPVPVQGKESFFGKLLKGVGAIAIIAVLAVAGFYFLSDKFKPGGGGNESSSLVSNTPSPVNSSGTGNTSTGGQGQSGNGSGVASGNNPVHPTPTPEAIVTPPPASGTQQSSGTTEQDQGDVPQWEGDIPNGYSYAAFDDPQMSDFYWYASDPYIEYDRIYDFRELFGPWKMMLIYEGQGRDMGFFYIDGDPSDQSVWSTVQGKTYIDEEGNFSESEYDMTLPGSFLAGEVTVSNNENLSLEVPMFYLHDGKQYAVGEGLAAGSIHCTLLLTRP